MNRPLLTIAVPTYNRPESLSALHRRFLAPVLRRCGPQVEVLVCDNSNKRIATQNAQLVAPSARHIKNTENLGFALNVLQCAKLATGKFFWCLSDNDDIYLDEAIELIRRLETIEPSEVNAVLLPYEVQLWSGRTTVRNAAIGANDLEGITLSDVLSKSGDVPFILFSSVVTRMPERDKDELLDEVEATWSDNDFVQIPLLLSLIGLSGIVCYHDRPLIRYQVELVRRFDLIGMQRSLDCVIDWIEDKGFDVSRLRHVSLHRWIVLALFQRAGLVAVNGVNRFRSSLAYAALGRPRPLRLFLLIALWIPKPLFAWPYLIWLSTSEWRTSGQWKLKQLIGLRMQVARSTGENYY